MDVNSAYALGALYNIQKQQQQDEAQKKEILLKGAEANVQQNELLLKQLEEIKQQNVLLSKLYEDAKQEAKDNAKEAKQNKVFGWISFGVGTFLGIIGNAIALIALIATV